MFCYDDSLWGRLMEKVRVRAKWGVQGCGWWLLTKLLWTLPNTPGCFLFFFCESFGNRASSSPAVVMGRGSKQAVSQQKGIELWATINTLQHTPQTFSAKTGNINHYRFAVHFNVFFWYEHIHPWFLFYFRDIINMCDKFPFWKAVSVKKGNWFVSWCTWIAKFISFHQRLDVDVLLWWGSKHQW